MFTRSFWEDMNEFRRSFDHLFERMSTQGGATPEQEYSFRPLVETGWTEDALNLRFLVPGVPEKDLKVTAQGNQILIQGERKAPEGFEKIGTGFWNMGYGKFERTIDLPVGLNLEKMKAHLHEGVLDIMIPRAEEMKPRKIPIRVEGKKQEKLEAAA